MHTMTGKYLGDLRTEAVHLLSGQTIITDAPPDNNGKGAAFSPTDLTCASLNACMMTLMGIVAAREGIDLTGLTSKITKTMNPAPRKIAAIEIVFHHSGLVATKEQKEKLVRAARTCPVALSLASEIVQTIEFNF